MSPIEKIMEERFRVFHDFGWNVVQQCRFGPYIADFWIEVPKFGVAVVVECDGHTYHDRTDKQADHDRRRDRYFLRAGIPTIRLSSTDIFARPDKCEREVVETINALCENIHRVIVANDEQAPCDGKDSCGCWMFDPETDVP